MAAEDEGRTEEPSEHRLEQARKEGRVAKSQEISSALILLLTITVLLFTGKWMLSQCINILTYFFTRTHNPDLSDANYFSTFLINFLDMLAPVAGVAVVAAITANIIQNKGFIFSTKPIEPNFNKIVPKFGEYFRKTVFSGKGLFNIAKSILKVTIIVIIGYLTIRKNIFVIIEIVSNGQILPAIGKIASTAAQIVIIVAVLFLALSIPDFFVQRHEFRESMKMTKQEVKQEYKELEGDPEVKGRLQQMQRQLLAQNIPKAVKEADVVITNPTHYAVVLKYDEAAGDEAPKVTAKGEDQTALYIKQLAKDNGIPIQEDRPLARSLYTDVQIGAIIPGIYWKAIALVYSHIQNKSQANEN
ncbi:MAG: flagellar biosynthesis protein FlhB [Treponema sp.]|nr:flagellar biosynthesis protein FlhB [Treponema sp.]